MADLINAKNELIKQKEQELEFLNNIYIAHSNKNFTASILCCFGALLCFSGNPLSVPFLGSGGGGLAVAKGQEYWAKRGVTAAENDLGTVQQEITKLESFFGLQTGTKMSTLSMFAHQSNRSDITAQPALAIPRR